MEQNNVTHGLLAVSSDELFIYGVSNDNIVAVIPDAESDKERFPGNAKRLVTAVNATYGSGINPEAVPDLLEALENILAWDEMKAFSQLNMLNSLHPISKSIAAIEKAKLITL